MADKTIGVALFGAGRAGQFHMPNVCKHPKTKLLYVIDSIISRAEEGVKTYGGKALATGDEALKDPAVGAVIVATTTPTHYDIIMKALAAGKPIFSEKPVGFTLKEIDEVYAEAKKRNITLLCGFNRRFDPSWEKAWNLVRNGYIGIPQIIRSTARDSPVPTLEYLKTSHGFVHDAGIHDIDVVCWMAASHPTEVFASAHCFNQEIATLKDIDTIVINFKFASGTVANIDLSRKSVYGYDQRVEVFGDKGMVQVENKPTTTVVLSSSQGELRDNIQYSFPQRFAEAYYIEFEHFIDILTKGAQPKVSHLDVRNAFIICEAVIHSYSSGQKVVVDYNQK